MTTPSVEMALGADSARRHRPFALGALVTIGLYVTVFFGVLPFVLWKIGARVDQLLSLRRADVGELGIALALFGVAFMVWSMLSLSVRGRGLPISHLPPARLVARGPYAWIRHPIYVGYAFAWTGLALVSGSVGRASFSTALLIIGSIVYANVFEEARLHRRFGAAYREYAEQVPAFPWPRRAINGLWRIARPPFERIANRVVLFRIGRTLWVSYGAFGGIGAALALTITHTLVRPYLELAEECRYLLVLGISILIGARLVALLYNPRLLIRSPREALRRVGFVSWGGYIAFFIVPFVLFTPTTAWIVLDRSIVGALACSAIGRLGCLSYGCCYGRYWDDGIRWHHRAAKPNREHPTLCGMPRVPTQILACVSALALASVALLLNAYAPPTAAGAATIFVCIVYCFMRFGIESLRDEQRFVGLTRGQIWSGVGAIVWLGILLVHSPRSGSHQGEAMAVGVSSTAGWLAVAGVSAITFVACSLHVRRVGRW